MTKLLLHALSELVRLAKETPGPSLLGTLALVVHVTARSDAIQRRGYRRVRDAGCEKRRPLSRVGTPKCWAA